MGLERNVDGFPRILGFPICFLQHSYHPDPTDDESAINHGDQPRSIEPLLHCRLMNICNSWRSKSSKPKGQSFDIRGVSVYADTTNNRIRHVLI